MASIKSIATGSDKPSEEARNFQTKILQRISMVKQVALAECTGLSEATVNRIVSGERGVKLDELHDFLAAIGMAIVERDGDMVSVPKKELDSIRYLAGISLLNDERRNRRPA